ncbi:hypothetical protein Tco_1486108, partial [Tanacetum coccineum]
MFMDEIVESESVDVITAVTPSDVKTVESEHQSHQSFIDTKLYIKLKSSRSVHKDHQVVSEPKTESADVKIKRVYNTVGPKIVRKNNFIPPVIKDWNSDDESEVEIIPTIEDKIVRPSTEKIKFVKSARETVEKVIRPVWNNSSRVNHKNFANKMTHPHSNRRFVPLAVLTRSGKINIVGASVNTAVRQINTAGSITTMNHPRPISNAYKKGVKDTTTRDRAVVSENKGKWANAVKASACWQKEYKEKGVIDSGFSRHMTGNKCYLTEYEDYDDGFISFGDGKGRNSRK